MPVVQYGFPGGGSDFYSAGITQPGTNGRITQTGESTFTIIKQFPISNWYVPSFYSSYAGLYPYDVSYKSLEGNIQEVTVQYKGTYGGVGGLGDPIYELQNGLSTEPIDSHPAFYVATAGFSQSIIYSADSNPGGRSSSGYLDNDQNKQYGAYFEVIVSQGVNVTGAFIAFGSKSYLAGVKDYLVPQMTWTQRYATQTAPTDISNVGKATDSPPGSPPSLPGNGNWLYSALHSTTKNGTYEITNEYRGSGQAGPWDFAIYNSF